jgi:hypothetical protein
LDSVFGTVDAPGVVVSKDSIPSGTIVGGQDEERRIDGMELIKLGNGSIRLMRVVFEWQHDEAFWESPFHSLRHHDCVANVEDPNMSAPSNHYGNRARASIFATGPILILVVRN